MNPQKIIIDTDPGGDIDDLLAIQFALNRPELEVLAVTTSTYPAARRAGLAQRLLGHLGRPDIPVAAGMDLPLRPLTERQRAAVCHEAVVFNHDLNPPAGQALPSVVREDAAELIIRTVEAHPGEVVFAAIAPLTNLACALCRSPMIAGKIRQLNIMGGELHLNRKEHNIAHDPAAAEIVLNAGIPLCLGTWDVTRRLVLDDATCRRFDAHPAPLYRQLAAAIAAWHPVQSWKPGPVMYDLFPLVHAMAPAVYTLKPMAVRVDNSDGPAAGMTVAVAGTPNAQVTTDVDAESLRELYLATVFPE